MDPVEVAVPVRFELLPDRVERAGAQHVADVGVALQPLVGSVDAVGAHDIRFLIGERHQFDVGDPRRGMVAELRMGAGARAQPVLGEGDFLIGQIGHLPEDLLQTAALEVSAGVPFEDGEGLIAGEPGPQPHHVAGGVVPVDLTDVAGVDADRDGVRTGEVQPAGDVGRSGLRVGHEHGAAERGRLVGQGSPEAAARLGAQGGRRGTAIQVRNVDRGRGERSVADQIGWECHDGYSMGSDGRAA